MGLLRISKIVLPAVLAAAGLAAQAGHASAEDAKKKVLPSERLANTDTEYNAPVTMGQVGDVVKGDELTLRDGTEVRLIGVSTPIAAFSQRQGEYYGKGAIELTKKLAAWKTVRLEYDKQTHDRKGRLLAYAYVDGKMLQEELLRNGHAFAEAFPPNVKYRDKFIALQKEAMKAKKGMWGLKPGEYPKVNEIDKYVIEGVMVKRAINGDSIELEDGSVVRYIGIDAPDSENRQEKGQVGNAAWLANKALVQGKEVTIEYDVEPKDPRGRDLAWVYVNNELVNARLVKDGHAVVAVFPPNVKYLDALFKAQDEAAKANRGIWSGDDQ